MFAFARIRGESSSNDRTYFGRLVEHPCDGEPVDQFTRIIRRLRTYGHNGNHAAPVYEASLPVPALVEQDISDTGEPAGDPSDDAPKLSLAIYTPRSDGNYLALGLLQRYIAEAAGFRAGTLTVVTGQAEAEGGKRDVERTLAAFPLFTAAPSTPDRLPLPRPAQQNPAQADGSDELSLLPDQW